MFAIIDIETTGSNYKFGQITEIAIIQHNGNKITGTYCTLIRPEMDIPLYITRMTGISNEMVRNAPRFYEIAKDVLEWTAGRIFVAHNVNLDYRFIKEEFKHLGYTYFRKTLCTVKLSRKLLPGYRSYSLGKICAEKGIEINGRHRAEGDAIATARLFEILIQENERRDALDAANSLKLF